MGAARDARLNRLCPCPPQIGDRLRLTRSVERAKREPAYGEHDAENRQNHEQLHERDASHQTGRSEYTACSSAAAVNATRAPKATISAGSNTVTSVRRPRSASC